MAFIGNIPSNVPLTGSQIANGTIVNANVATNTLNLTQKVTSTLPFANGGTGLSALGTAGQALVVNSGATALQYSTVGATAGQVIQVLSATDSTSRSTTSTSFVTGSNTLSATITPSSSSNKILIIVTSATYIPYVGSYFTIYRGATDLGAASNKGMIYGRGTSNEDVIVATAMSYLDSPSTTSATTYQVYFRSATSFGATHLNFENAKGSITVMEIKG